MNNLRSTIVKKAMDLFSLQGYYATSMQQIAETCEIAKGTLYNSFSSKDNLFIEVFKQCFENFFEGTLVYNFPSTSKELSKQIFYQMEYFVEHRFIMIDYRELPIGSNKQFLEVRNTIRERMLDWHRKCLISAYGEKISPYMGDLLLCFRGIIKEYELFFSEHKTTVSIENSSEYIHILLDGIVNHVITLHAEPSISYYLLNNTSESFDKKNDPKTQLQNICTELTSIINKMEPFSVRSEYNNIIFAVQEELLLKEPRPYILHALLDYISKSKECKILTQRAFAMIQYLLE